MTGVWEERRSAGSATWPLSLRAARAWSPSTKGQWLSSCPVAEPAVPTRGGSRVTPAAPAWSKRGEAADKPRDSDAE